MRNSLITRAWMNAGATLMEKPLPLSPALTRMTSIAMSVINQDYIGDINILPSRKFFNPFKILAYLNEKEIRELPMAGLKATWPKMEMIRIQTCISRTLQGIMEEYDGEHVQHVKSARVRKAG